MTNEQYQIIITVLTDKIQEQAKKIDELETRVFLRDYDIKELREKIESVEKGGAK